MRRIIERVVTVVTTTTWTISWQEDPPPANPEADASPTLPIAADTPGNHLLSANKPKEAEISRSKAESNFPEDETSDSSKNNLKKRKEKLS